MKRAEFERKLGELRDATSVATARTRMLELRDHASRMDAVLREQFRVLLEQWGLPSPVNAEIQLAAGETWLLLYDTTRSNGCAVRLEARAEAAPGDTPLQLEVRRAHHGLLAAAARACRELDRPTEPAIDVDAPYSKFELEGGSLGLSVAVATVSTVLRCAPAVSVAGSAQVDEEGGLHCVEHLAPKLEALHRCWPEVESVVVALGQLLPLGYISPVRLIEIGNLDEALPLFGLSLDGLSSSPLEHYRERLARFETENNKAHGECEWRRLSSQAWEASVALSTEDESGSVKAALWAALFAVHSGDPGAADAFLRRVPESTTADYPELLARKLIAIATKLIDEDGLQEAVALAERAVTLCEGGMSPGDRRELLGQALGTKGRALMHRGEYADAERDLRSAFEHHTAYIKREASRSACYLATCLRLSGRLKEALLVADAALATIDAPQSTWLVAVTTRLFLRLERGRIKAALGCWEEATTDFIFVRSQQLADTAYPRLAAVRGLASAFRALGRSAEADTALDECVRLAQLLSAQQTLQRVAAVAAGEALLDGQATQSRTSELEAVWAAAFGHETTRERIAKTVRAWIY